ncbi:MULTISPECIES: glycosyl hydrolase family 18 protein [unclassified Sphingomonas]|uniref:glycosyl hydrolase family 18 protein n=1 Tax=unclassified Sphingomonas TaxID=196159 RepID=UPI0021516025|nr:MULTISPECIES: glycosyl hydrolase family 18 protein [unclassified Sphingomonas]MCR5871194.1 glycosyl hydrolase family 18 protein [Sphingomonas sp. J344]UUY00495.1 glycosyl hydrolase family 18 protein [Sphingomonas sp. J315]
MSYMSKLYAALRSLIGFALVLSASTAHAAPSKPVMVGYVAAFKGIDLTIARTRLEDYTHFNLAFANPDASGAFVNDGQLTCMPAPFGAATGVAELRARVEQLRSKGAKVLVSIGGGVIPSCSGDWNALLASDKRDATVASLVALSDTLGLDGVDVDLEGELLTAIDRAGNYTPFIAALSRAMQARGKLLTCATASYEGGMIPIDSIRYFDLVNVMSYDAIGPSWGPAGAEHATLAMAERDLKLWRERGVARDRLVLGVPFYGYGFNGHAANWSYRDLVSAFPQAATGDTVGKACAGCRYITHNSPATIEAKARLAQRIAAGVMVWELSQDSPDHALTRAALRGLSAAETRASN